MMEVTERVWAELVEQCEAAMREADAAFYAYDRLPPQESEGTDEERRYDAARDAAYEHEDRLLALKPPSLAAAAYQLKLFGLRYHSVDLDEAAIPGEDVPQGSILRGIHEKLVSAGA